MLVATRGADALALAREYRPTAVSLDVFLPDMLGWTVLSQLKQDPATRHIPVQIVTLDEDRQHGLARGAFSFITKPTTTEGLEAALTRIKEYAQAAPQAPAGGRGQSGRAAEHHRAARPRRHRHLAAGTGGEALAALREQPCDCVVLDLRLPDMSGFEVLEQIARRRRARRCAGGRLHRPRALARGGRAAPHLARSVVVKGVESPERLLDETALFLHRVVTDLPPEKQRMLERLHRSDEDLVGRAVLVVDDDVRNIFALSSVLERRGMQVLTASTGSEAIALLEATPDVAIVLMDIMMPEMDGYQTMQAIRAEPGVPPPADHRADRQGDEGRPREMPRGRRLRLSRQAGQHRAAAVGAADVAAPLSGEQAP